MNKITRKQLRHVFSVKSGATPNSATPEFWDGDILWATPEDIGSLQGYLLNDTRRKITRAGYESCGTFIAPKGSIILSKRAPIGQVAILNIDSCCNQGCFLLTIKDEIDSRFFYYWLVCNVAHLQALGRGSTFMELSTDDLKAQIIPYPALSKQTTISNYLDHETARIDSLIATKEHWLNLLAEKRRALITHAVTRGCDPNVPLKDSGLQWLGKIPKHWKCIRLRYLINKLEQGWSPEAENKEPDMGEWGVLKINAVNKGKFNSSAAKALPNDIEARKDLEIKAGDFLITRSNTPLLVGDACFVEHTREQLMLCDLIYRLALKNELILGKYLCFFLSLPIGRVQIETDARGTSGSMVKISQDHIKNWLIPLPPVLEQHEIIATIEQKYPLYVNIR